MTFCDICVFCVTIKICVICEICGFYFFILSFFQFFILSQRLDVSNIEHILVAIVVVAPRAVLPEALHDIRLVLVVLRLSVLAGIC